ncbi:hypothetical protein OGAPHI_006795 [Ogataea philodendri]|uniref:Uncharacterized protein n=1 Tax=Ogataea philodendri TaxID=1378263 RepID=A0A9P8NW52_9ASCO|nr:uncharacterized protein OGAPHI_006795 [Ogataea philodendri]KAH3661388.1 hypothetical protein OGAPHI_006795 [Ogataea philodendri]
MRDSSLVRKAKFLGICLSDSVEIWAGNGPHLNQSWSKISSSEGLFVGSVESSFTIKSLDSAEATESEGNFGQTEVSNFDVHVWVKEDVSKLQVSVDDSSSVQVFDSTDDLNHEKSHFWFTQNFSGLEKVHQRLMRTNLQQNVDINIVFETVNELDNVGMRHALVDFDLTQKLGLGLLVLDGRLSNGLGSVDTATLVFHLETSGKSSFTKEQSSMITSSISGANHTWRSLTQRAELLLLLFGFCLRLGN